MYVETAEDLNRKYSSTYALLKEKLVFFYEFTLLENHLINARYTSEKDEQCETIDPEDIKSLSFDSMFINNIEFKKPEKKIMRIAAVLFKRKALRQWRRGINSDTVSITCPLTPLYRAFGNERKLRMSVDLDLSFNLITRLRNPQYPTFDQAIDLCQTYQAVAVSPMFAICLNNTSNEKYLLTSKYGFIGEVIPGHAWIYHAPSQQEFSDYIMRSKQKILIEVATCPQI